jgi:triosephosphate isomerase
MRNKVIAGNWKMYTTIEEGVVLVKGLNAGLENNTLENKKIIVIPPFLHIPSVIEEVKKAGKIHVGAQNCHHEKEGAYTGEISPRMLKQAGVEYVTLGHSERRQYFKEDNGMLTIKTAAALAENLLPIYCCGETLSEREAGKEREIVQQQVEEGLFNLTEEQIKNVIVAYEPVWAIGTGKTASPEQAQEMHAHIRGLFRTKYGENIASDLIILYGGSVKPNNAAELFGMPDIDGGLVGGASLKAEDFLGIITSC